MDMSHCSSLSDTYSEARTAEDKSKSGGRFNQAAGQSQGGKQGRWDNNQRRESNKDVAKDADRSKNQSRQFNSNQNKPQQQSSLFTVESQESPQQLGKDQGAQ